MPSVASRSVWGGNVAWVVIFLANLIVLLWCGWQVTRDSGRAGMIAATALMLLLTLRVVPKWSEFRMTLVVGGIFTAIAQTVPVIQIVGGILSLRTVEFLGLVQGYANGPTEPGGFLATLLMACMMLAAAFMSGVFLRGVSRAESWVLQGDDWPGPPADWQIQRSLRERQR
ncbi:MAG: hypothetical protein K8U57_40155 [Planctomycetes bacterium]|nr:hypothetical protein [Planctomycetota bacterium]